MPFERLATDVWVSRGNLRIGADIYPLRTITMVRPTRHEPDRPAAIKRLVIRVPVCWFVGSLLIVSGQRTSTPAAVFAIAVTTGAFAFLCVSFFRQWRMPTLYRLSIETAGRLRTVVTSTDPAAVTQLARRLTDALDRPDIEFHQRIDTLHIGDKITQYGHGNIGKVTQ